VYPWQHIFTGAYGHTNGPSTPESDRHRDGNTRGHCRSRTSHGNRDNRSDRLATYRDLHRSAAHGHIHTPAADAHVHTASADSHVHACASD
jgi:hypothetical protein